MSPFSRSGKRPRMYSSACFSSRARAFWLAAKARRAAEQFALRFDHVEHAQLVLGQGRELLEDATAAGRGQLARLRAGDAERADQLAGRAQPADDRRRSG